MDCERTKPTREAAIKIVLDTYRQIVYNKLEALNNTEILDESGSFKTYEKVEHEFDMVAVEAGHIRRLARISGGATRYKYSKQCSCDFDALTFSVLLHLLFSFLTAA